MDKQIDFIRREESACVCTRLPHAQYCPASALTDEQKEERVKRVSNEDARALAGAFKLTMTEALRTLRAHGGNLGAAAIALSTEIVTGRTPQQTGTTEK